VVTWPTVGELNKRVMTQPLETLKLQTICFLKSKWFGSLQFVAADGNQSCKFGDKYKLQDAYRLRSQPLVRITVHKNNEYVVGLTFSYADKSIDSIMGTNGVGVERGPLQNVEIDLDFDEHIVGVTVDQCEGYPRRIGFTIMRF